MRFVDWRGEAFSLREEWHYVNGPAQPRQMGAGMRDERHEGKRAADFLVDVNGFIRARRMRAERPSRAGAAPGEVDARSDYDASLLMLPEESAYLSLDEVIAVRLYSGPACAPRPRGRLHGRR